jgi:UDP-glucose 4-epimerase
MTQMFNNNSRAVCLVIGANGFIGSHIVDNLSSHSNLIIRALDRYTRKPQFIPNASIEIIKGDLFDDDVIMNAMKNVDYLIHSFSATNPFVSDNDPYTDITDNLLRNVKIFELASKNDVKNIGFISSGGAVYGGVADNRAVEETEAPLPISPYGVNKLASEYYLEYFKRKFGIDYTIYRLTNPYGPRQITKNNQGVIPLFIEKILNDEELTIYGDGSSSRDYIYMPDAADMIVSSFRGTRKYNIYNIGSGIQTNINDIILSLSELTNKIPRVKYVDAPKTFLAHTRVSNNRFITEFGERTLTSLQYGLKMTLEANTLM